MLFIGPAHMNAGPSNQRASATAHKASKAVRHAVSCMPRSENKQEANDPTSLLAEAPSYLLLPTLREIFDNPDRAFRKGEFRRINAESLDLPPVRDTPNPTAASLWVSHLPPPLADVFNNEYRNFFVKPLATYVKTGTQARTLPLPKTHASSHQYCQLLKRAELAGMLRWSIVSEEDEEYSDLADAIQLTLFAVSKTQKRTRLISWPRVQNDALPNPPYIHLPDPSLFEAVEVNADSLSAYYLDIANIFHNITLPAWLTKLFPLKTVQAHELDSVTLERIKKQLPQLEEKGNQLLRPCQATMPMGFKWSVFIAHSFVSGCLDQAYKLFRTSRLAPSDIEHSNTLHAERAPFIVNPIKPLILHIIDDVTFVATGWSDEAVTAWHRITRRVLALNGLPVNEKKSCSLGVVEKRAITFIGCHWDFASMSITPSPDKLASAIQQCNILVRAHTVSVIEWQRIIGRLVWIAILNRPLLACMQRVFASASETRNQVIQIEDTWKKELRTLFPLLPMAVTSLNADISPLVIAFDASLKAGAVTKTVLDQTLVQSLWNQGQAARCTNRFPQNHELPIVKLISKAYPWKKVLAHQWINREHINGLEAAAAVLALESAIRAGVHNQRLVMLTDSLVVLGALQKGRSSSPNLLVRCRRFAALALAHNIRVTLVYVKSANNPADPYTRSTE